MCTPQVPGVDMTPAYIRGIDGGKQNVIPKYTTTPPQRIAHYTYQNEAGQEQHGAGPVDEQGNLINPPRLARSLSVSSSTRTKPGVRIINPAYVAEAQRRTEVEQKKAEKARRAAIPPPPPPAPPTPPTPPPSQQAPVVGPQTPAYTPVGQPDLAGTAGRRRGPSGSTGGRGSLVIPIDLGGAGGGHSLAIPT